MSWLRHILGSIIIIILIQLPPTYGASPTDDDNNDPPYHDCDDGFSYSSGSKFEENLNDTFLSLSDTTSLTYSKSTIGTGIDQVYALYFCRGDADFDTCHQCIQHAVQELVQKCKHKKQGIVWYELCTLRYANHTIFSLDEDTRPKRYRNTTNLVSDPILKPHRQLFDNTMEDLITKAVNSRSPLGFARNEANLSSSLMLRGIAQCSPFINHSLCDKCLNNAFRWMDLFSNTILFLPNCNIRFDLSGSPPPLASEPSSPKPDFLPERYKVLLQVLLPVILFFSIVGGGFLCYRRRRPPGETINNGTEATGVEINDMEPRPQLAIFTYQQVKHMTNDFNRKLGEGGYGIVYYGRLSDSNREVAVKVLSNNHAAMQFSNEIRVLGRIYHKNLVSLIGYCEEETNLALVYEYMSKGDLKDLLSDRSDAVISWKIRLKIAFDTAQGLDYLHTGCSPSIVHRDVKPANILLDQQLQAKVADFGFSKVFPPVYISRLETRVIGTPGYLDPQYHSTGQLNEKSDVYSFGVVLLELITGKTALIDNTNTNLLQWVTPLFESGDIDSILDPRLRLEVGENSSTVWRVTDLAKKCVEFNANLRPTMTGIVTELRECLAMENGDAMSPISANTSMEMTIATVSTTSFSPQPR